jgi:hypothetical protein
VSAEVAREVAALVALVVAYRRAKATAAQATARMSRDDCAAYANALLHGLPRSPVGAAFEAACDAERDARDAMLRAVAELTGR